MYWNSIFFTDESKICCTKSGVSFIRKRLGAEWTNEMTEPENLYHNRIEVMVWGMISYDGPVELVEVVGRMNA